MIVGALDTLSAAHWASGIDWPKGVAFHMFRKTAATLLHHHGKSGRQLCGWMGHHDPAFTIRTYVGEADEGLGDPAFFDGCVWRHAYDPASARSRPFRSGYVNVPCSDEAEER
jgi:hypothetical protein